MAEARLPFHGSEKAIVAAGLHRRGRHCVHSPERCWQGRWRWQPAPDGEIGDTGLKIRRFP
jgi:hypothetical protein